MFEKFRGWKRKAGLVTLLLACIVSWGWLRSLSRLEVVYLNKLAPRYILISGGGVFRVFEGTAFIYEGHTFANGEISERKLSLAHTYHFGNRLHNWRAWPRVEGWPLPNLKVDCGFKDKYVFYAVTPYWAIVMPLTLLSAWLLLSKSRPTASSTSAADPRPTRHES